MIKKSTLGVIPPLVIGLTQNFTHAACISGGQCEESYGLVTTAPNGSSFVPAGTGKPNAALVATNGSTIEGENLTISGSTNNSYSGYAGAGSTLDLTDATINAWGGLHANGVGSKILMKDGTISTTDTTIELLSGGSAELTDVDLSVSGSNKLVVRVMDNSSFTMKGGSITGMQLLGAMEIAGGTTVNLTDVTVNSAGLYGIGRYFNSSSNNVLNLRGGSVTHNSTNGNAAVQFGGSGDGLIDGTIVKATGLGMAVMVVSTNGTSHLTARNFDFSSVGAYAHGLNVNQNGVANLKDGRITTYGNNAFGIWVSPTGNQASALVAENLKVETHGVQAHGIYAMRGLSKLTHVDIEVKGAAFGLASHGVTSDVHMTHGSIHATGANAVAAFAHDKARLELTNSSIHAMGTNAIAAIANAGAHLELSGSTANSLNNTTGGTGVRVQSGSSAMLKDKTSVLTDGASAPGLVFLGATATNSISLDNSQVTAQDSFAVLANGGTDTLNVSNHSVINGDRLVYAGDCSAATCGSVYGSKLTINSDSSQLFGHANVSDLSTLRINLDNDSLWTLRSSAGGLAQSRLSFLNLDNSHIVFEPSGSGLYQQLRVGAGNTGGNPSVYHAGNGASITLNTLLNSGGAGNQYTDQILIEGDVSGVTQLHINEVAGSPGGLTSPSGTYLASEGISLVQVSGAATEGSFVLAGGYLTMNSQPYIYKLYAYGPGSSNGAADASQKQVGGLAHWDWRLQSSEVPSLVPQAYSYLAAPNALFQAGLMDMATLHRRLGDMSMLHDDERQHEVFLRAYGGELDYRAGRRAKAYTPNANMNYKAVQMGANLGGWNDEQQSIRLGLSGNQGKLSFAPKQVAGSRRTELDVWAISPTLTWQHASGGYVDALVSHGAFSGAVSTSARGKTTRLKGQRNAASLEGGLPLTLGVFKVEPQMQLAYQRLKLERKKDIDNFPLEGRLAQWTLRTGSDIQIPIKHSAIKLRGNVHLVQTLNSQQKITMGEDFYTGKFGTTLNIGVGVDASFTKNGAWYGEVTHQQRLSREGYQGVSASIGIKLGF